MNINLLVFIYIPALNRQLLYFHKYSRLTATFPQRSFVFMDIPVLNVQKKNFFHGASARGRSICRGGTVDNESLHEDCLPPRAVCPVDGPAGKNSFPTCHLARLQSYATSLAGWLDFVKSKLPRPFTRSRPSSGALAISARSCRTDVSASPEL